MGVASKSGQFSSHVIDPTTPPKVLLTLPAAEFQWTDFTVEGTVDRSKKTATFQGQPFALEVINRKLVKVPLARPGTPAAIQVSSISDACSVAGVIQMDATGADAFVGVSTAGTDNICDTVSDNETKIVLMSNGPGAPPSLSLPQGQYLSWHLSIGDASGKLAWLIVTDSRVPGAGKLVAYSADLRTKFDVPGSENAGGAYIDNLGFVVPLQLSDGVYAWVDKTLRRMNADGAGLRLSAPLYTSTTQYGPSRLQWDGSDAYFTDGNALMRLRADTVTALATLPAAYEASLFLGQTASKLVLRHDDIKGSTLFTAIDKSSGKISTPLTGDINKPNNIQAITSDALFYFTGKRQSLGDLRRVQLDGSGDTLIEAGVFSVDGLGFKTTRRTDFSYGLDAAESTLYCKPSSGALDCRTGKLFQFDIATAKITDLGVFTGSTVPAWKFGVVFGGNTEPLVAVNGASTADKEYDLGQDLWLFTPGQANSLRRVTTNLP